MKPHVFIFTICSLLLSACQRQDEASREIETYLHDTHGIELNDSSIYCFFPANQCKNCFLYNARYTIPEINAHTVIITGFDSTNFTGFKHILRDSDNAMLQLRALDYGNRIITFKDGQIKRNEVVKDLYAQLENIWPGR
ncbi:MAG: hypothetical protein O9353_13305 [Bacteroidia bacterium]|nr:hypothetical protein [Bacteroidia bacterium]